MRAIALPALVLAGVLVLALTWALWPTPLERALADRDAGRYAQALPELEALATRGDRDAQVALGGMLAAGQGTTADPAAARTWLRKAAEQGHEAAALALGDDLAGRPDTIDAALGWYRKAAGLGSLTAYERVQALADGGSAQAELLLGRLYAERAGGLDARYEAPRHLRKAVESGLADGLHDLRRLAADGVREAALALAELADEGRPAAATPADAAQWYARAAELGDKTAQFRLGERYARGRGVPRDPAQAAHWYGQAAAQGHGEAQLRLAEALATGTGVARDDAAAIGWLVKAVEQERAGAVAPLRRFAEAGHPRAQFALGRLYAEGRMVPRDPARAVAWTRRAAKQGHPQAAFELGFAYAEGQGVARDPARAAHWYGRAADAGNELAMPQLRLLAGDGVPEALFRYGRHLARGGRPAVPRQREAADLVESVTRSVRGWFSDPVADGVAMLRQAAEAGHAGAQLELGLLYESGTGVDKDARQAREWFAKAAAQGNARARERLARAAP